MSATDSEWFELGSAVQWDQMVPGQFIQLLIKVEMGNPGKFEP